MVTQLQEAVSAAVPVSKERKTITIFDEWSDGEADDIGL